MLIAHLSDLHFGHHDPALAAGLAADITSQSPDLVIVSGDFTQSGNTREFRQAREFLDTLSTPWLAVPGNHDVPQINMLRRIVSPYGLFRRYIHDDLEPFLVRDGVAIAGLNTSRQFRLGLNWAHGSISRDQLDMLEERFSTAPAHDTRIVVAHHPLLFPEEAMQKKMRLVKRADLALQLFARLGVKMVLSGHFHMTYVRKHENPGATREADFEGARESAAAHILVLQASSTISTRLRGHLNGYNLIDTAGDRIRICVREWNTDGWRTREDELLPT